MVEIKPADIGKKLKGLLETFSERVGEEKSIVESYMVLRAASNAGAVFVDDVEDPKAFIYAAIGTHGLVAKKMCLILGAEGDLPKHAILSVKQFAKEHQCSDLVYTGDDIGELAKQVKTTDTQPFIFEKL